MGVPDGGPGLRDPLHSPRRQPGLRRGRLGQPRPPITRGRLQPEPEPEPQPRANWADGFGPSGPRVELDPEAILNVKGWGGPARSHAGESPDEVARIVVVELLILRFELECSIDLFIRSPEDRNLSCSIHITWPVAELALVIPGDAKIHKRINEALKSKGVRKHALNKRSSIEDGRLDAWFTYPTAVMASEALEAFREAIVKSGLEVEKQVREMAIPRPSREPLRQPSRPSPSRPTRVRLLTAAQRWLSFQSVG